MTLLRSWTCLRESTSISFSLMDSGSTTYQRCAHLTCHYVSRLIVSCCSCSFTRPVSHFKTSYMIVWLSPLQPTVTSELGTINNLIQVKKSDFEVFDALQVDSLECSDTSGETGFYNVTVNKFWIWLPDSFCSWQICPAPLLVHMGRSSTSADLSSISKPRPYSLLTSSKSFSTRTHIYLWASSPFYS